MVAGPLPSRPIHGLNDEKHSVFTSHENTFLLFDSKLERVRVDLDRQYRSTTGISMRPILEASDTRTAARARIHTLVA